ncbi:hypothetical protein BCR37DRAFT_382778 [Protomyces lactucae-debilis]|uniref:Uncharacterized protein n=1 Tax=Protomyces lactucae-debilis TaxID=2754530 RepID=A0A1Y2ES41_PROLT|nr:uncharacterized protein BCR37DRAFT_384486 [Protomyces lactucae-debilis]XP_040722932.1 uncharacterized protein BCR37DRAFT_382778 [Protomyces lactucae-debilis]ORY74369.1 hypothetical protein BCR37DRAFT_384486 [Protomyces lactucae-debilis]ORY77311.1 hypothetical protein BCR37DRAFT_382778 [Protomyces lactucae-debilis]
MRHGEPIGRGTSEREVALRACRCQRDGGRVGALGARDRQTRLRRRKGMSTGSSGCTDAAGTTER